MNIKRAIDINLLTINHLQQNNRCKAVKIFYNCVKIFYSFTNYSFTKLFFLLLFGVSVMLHNGIGNHVVAGDGGAGFWEDAAA